MEGGYGFYSPCINSGLPLLICFLTQQTFCLFFEAWNLFFHSGIGLQNSSSLFLSNSTRVRNQFSRFRVAEQIPYYVVFLKLE